MFSMEDIPFLRFSSELEKFRWVTCSRCPRDKKCECLFDIMLCLFDLVNPPSEECNDEDY